MVRRVAVQPIRELGSGKTRIVDGDSNDLVETCEIICRGPVRQSVIDWRIGRLLKSIHDGA
jgi:hypothetical protein